MLSEFGIGFIYLSQGASKVTHFAGVARGVKVVCLMEILVVYDPFMTPRRGTGDMREEKVMNGGIEG